MKKILQLQGMHCTSCALNIEKKLKALDGVIAANVNYASEKAHIEYNDKKINTEKIIDAVKSLGYSAAEMDLNGKHEDHMKHAEAGISLKFWSSLALSIPILILSMPELFSIFGLPTDMIMEFSWKNYMLLALATPVQFWAGWQFYKGALAGLKNNTANMDTLVALGTSAAYFYSLFSTFSDGMYVYYETSALLITFILLGKMLEAKAKGKASDAIKKLIGLSPKTALVIRNKKEVKISLSDVVVGDIIIVKPGDKIPVDGVVLEGTTTIDESMITGESFPVKKQKGDSVIGATINKNGSIKVKATKVGEKTVLAQIIKLIEEAQGSKAPIQKLADRVSAIFVPTVLVISIISFLVWYFIVGQTFSFSLMVAVSVLVIACPCALGLATPAAIIVGTGLGAQHGILIKSGEALEVAQKIDTILLDKTGTLTIGKPVVTDIISASTLTEKEIITITASLESRSEHPLAEAVLENAKKQKIKIQNPTSFEAVTGQGIKAKVGGKQYLLGNRSLINHSKIKIDLNLEKKINALENEAKTVVMLADQRQILGILAISDEIKIDSKEAIKKLQEMGIKPIMITGDNLQTAKAIAKKAGIKEVIAQVTPEEKSAKVLDLQKQGKVVAMVGDGINDSIALTAADVGIALGGGTDIAIESGEIVLMQDKVSYIPKAIKLSQKTMSKIKQNLFWAFIYNIAGIPVAAGILFPFTGWLLRPEIAGLAMALSSVSVVGNSLLLKRKKI